MTNQNLYDTDFNLWIEKTTSSLISGDFESVDWHNLIDEVESMGKSDKRALKSYTQRLIEHIFKLQYWHSELDRNKLGWINEIGNFRREINNILDDSPSLKNYLNENYLKWYGQSVKLCKTKGQFEVADHTPIELDVIMQDDFFG